MATQADFSKLSQTMCSIDLADSHWTQELPRLPVPDLCQSAGRYMASLKAVLAPEDGPTSGELDEAKRRQFQRTSQVMKHFLLTQGPELQRDLKEYANKCQNWATEFWLEDMYLSNPIPLPVNSNPFFMFPRQQFDTSEEMLVFATRIIQFAVEFKYRIDQQTLKQDFGSGHAKGKPLCMETYKNFFHSYRMPHEDMDRLLPQSRRSNHIVVASCDQFYILRLGQDPLPDPYRKEAGSVLDEASIYDQLMRIYRVSRENAKRQLMAAANRINGDNTVKKTATSKLHKIGLFTTENRKVWARLHKKLSHYSKSKRENNGGIVEPSWTTSCNLESLRQIEDCLFVMCLDSLVQPASGGRNHQRREPQHQASEDHETDVGSANVILSGAGSDKFTGNRWFDKFLQIIVGRDGVCGINIEHSASEGITVLRFLNEFLDFIRQNPVKIGCNKSRSSSISADHFKFEASPGGGLQQPAPTVGADSITSPGYVEQVSPSELLSESDKITPLRWELDEELELALGLAEQRVNKLIDNFSLEILRFSHFGRTFIKSQQLSPDAFVQLALQFTFYKLHGCLVSTYESASLRQFRLGRVDNIRANTCEAHEWIQAMLRASSKDSDDTSVTNRWRNAEEAFARAINKQVEILRYTITGSGPDNHLLALKQLARIRYDRDEMPDLFTDSSYQEYNNFRLSTSQLPNESGITVGYGAVVPDGYGCSYNPCPSCIVFCISSFVDCAETSSSRFAATLSESLLEMQKLCLGREHRPAC